MARIQRACAFAFAGLASGCVFLIWIAATIAVLVGAYTYGLTQNAARDLTIPGMVLDSKQINAGLLLLVEVGAIALTAITFRTLRVGSWVACLPVAAGAVVLAGLSFLGTWGFLSMERTDAMLERGDQVEARASLTEKLGHLKRQRQWSTQARSPAAIAAKIAQAEADPIFGKTRTAGCLPEKITLDDSREFCAAYRTLLAEQADAGRTAYLDAEIDQVEATLRGMKSVAVADPLAASLHRFLGIPEGVTDSVRPLAIAIVVHGLSIFGLTLAGLTFALYRPEPLSADPRGLVVVARADPAPALEASSEPQISPVTALTTIPEPEIAPVEIEAPRASERDVEIEAPKRAEKVYPQERLESSPMVALLPPPSEEQVLSDFACTLTDERYSFEDIKKRYLDYCNQRAVRNRVSIPRLGARLVEAHGFTAKPDRKHGNKKFYSPPSKSRGAAKVAKR